MLAPNFMLNLHTAFTSFVIIRKTTLAFGWLALILYNSFSLSNVVVLTPFWYAYLMYEACLHGFA